jgi:PD-(D/E)XK nuclease superfamily
LGCREPRGFRHRLWMIHHRGTEDTEGSLFQCTHDILGAAIEVHRRLDCGYRLDLIVDESVIVEVKAVGKVLPVHRAQVLTYLKLTNLRLGMLINFNVEVLRSGIYRIING